MKRIENQTFAEERALYALRDAEVVNCLFQGEEDGESAFKEAQDIRVKACDFHLRYPFWHTHRAFLSDIKMKSTCRAALWYAEDISVENSELFGIKALRECKDISIYQTKVDSAEFGWFCSRLKIEDSSLQGEYLFMHSSDIVLRGVSLKGKYSFQYCKNVEIHDSYLDTKDAFWESENVTVYNSTVKGEYLAWYAKNLRLVNCTVIGTQPLCYADGVVMENCRMEECDLSFEYSVALADIVGKIESVKNPLAGSVITADAFGEIILDENRRDEGLAKILVRNT